jgi:hypothetical protein
VNFPELLEAALTGTQNHPPTTVLADDADLTTEQRMLRGASFLSVRWLAGRPPEQPRQAARPAPALTDTSRSVPSAAAARLADILDRNPSVLNEWLELVRERGLRIPPLYLPELLEYARTASAEQRAAMIEVGGARMTWLANLNPDWQFAAYADPEAQFSSSAHQERPTALRRIRERDPKRGRELLQEAWRSERSDARAGLLATLQTGLSVDDEDLLTDALHDGRRDVREVALRLLRRIPGSRFAARWTERAQSTVIVSEHNISVCEPEEVDPAWVADGLDPRPPKDVGATAWLLQQVMALAPAAQWPTSLLAALDGSDWQTPLLVGLGEAAEAYADPRWCRELLLREAAAGERPTSLARRLLLALPQRNAEAVAQEVFESDVSYALQLLMYVQAPWTFAFSAWLIERISTLLAKHHAGVAGVLRLIASRADPGVLSRIEEWLAMPTHPMWLLPTLEYVVAALDYRGAMRRELDQT